MSSQISHADPCRSLKQNRLFLWPAVVMHPQKQGSCSSTSGMSFATWYAARVFSSVNNVGDSTSALLAAASESSTRALVPRNETHAIAARIAMAAIPSTRFCLVVDFNDSPLRLYWQ